MPGVRRNAVHAGVILLGWLAGVIAVKGYTPIMLMMVFIGCVGLMTQGFIGAYLWRTFENSKHRPLTLIQQRQVFSMKTAAGEANPQQQTL